MDDPTIFRVPLDDETMEAVLEQAAAAKVPPRILIASVVRDVFLAMRAEGETLVRIEPGDLPPTKSKH
ncbi:MAG: hypothetical protein KGL39_50270 [Patescibacteria group bacterium]|nr:hypothetical protein [Patescibacteria group bacterium]